MPEPSPEDRYRRRLLQELLSFAPGSVLEVGSGGGAFLRSAAGAGPALHGIDPDAESVRRLQAEGFDVQLGAAEALPFGAEAVDVVVFSYTAHHIADWPAALKEGLRVARLGVAVLDPWFDDRIPSQATAHAFDRWCKRIDRAGGMVHNDCLDAAALLGREVPARADLGVRYEYMLVLRELGMAQLDELAAQHLAEAHDPERWRLELTGIRQAAAVTGFSDEGAILLTIEKRSGS